MAWLSVHPYTFHRDYNDIDKTEGRFDNYNYVAGEQEATWDLTHRIQWAPPAAAAGGGTNLEQFHRYVMVKNLGTDPVLLYLNTQANAPNVAFEVSVLPGHWVEFVDLWMTVQPNIRVDSALYSNPVECEVIQIGEFTEIEEVPEEFCDLWSVGHTIQDGVITKHHPEVPGPWATIATPAGLSDFNHWFTDVAGVAIDDYWAVGYVWSDEVPVGPVDGLYGYWNGTTWAEVVVADDVPMYGVWGFETDDFWAVGGPQGGPGQIWLYGGVAWAFEAYPTGLGAEEERLLYCVHGDINTQITVAGEGGLISQNIVPPAWTEVGAGVEETDNLYGTWTSWTSSCWVCGGTAPWIGTPGGTGVIYRQTLPWGTAVWTPQPVEVTVEHPYPPTLRAMWGFHDQEIWAVGDNQTLLHWTGGPQWLYEPPPAELDGMTIHFRGVFGCQPWAVWACGTDEATENNVIIYWDGVQWTVDHGPNVSEGTLLGIKGVWYCEEPV